MIISHTYKFIYFPIPKTASQSFRVVLRELLKNSDYEEQQQFIEPTYLNNENLSKFKTGHLKYSQVKKELSYLDDYYKFSIVRNPFDRFISSCGFKTKLVDHKTLDDYIDSDNLWNIPQNNFICDDDRVKMDYIGRYETLEDSIHHITQTFFDEKPKIPVVNKTKVRNDLHYININQSIKDKIYQKFKKDFIFFY
jgi:hypothetical protein